MRILRDDPFSGFESLGILTLSDFLTGQKQVLATQEVTELDYPEGNVLLYQLSGLDFMCVRPSGTEPKIKAYFGCYGKDRAICEARQQAYETIVLARVNTLLGP